MGRVKKYSKQHSNRKKKLSALLEKKRLNPNSQADDQNESDVESDQEMNTVEQTNAQKAL